MTQLVRYEQARTALAECQRVDEVKDIRDKAEAMAAYARQAKDTELIQWATEIKVRAERQAGAMLAGAEKATGAEYGSRHFTDVGGRIERPSTPTPRLSDMGITKDQSSRWQSLAGMSDEHFETAVATAKDTAGQVTTAFMLREAKAAKPHAPAQKGAKADAMRAELKAAAERGVSMLMTYAGLTLRALRSQDSVSAEEASLLRELADAIAATTAKGSETNEN